VLSWFGDGRTFAATFFAVIIFTAIPLILINWKADWLITKRRITLLWLLFGFLVMFVIPYVWHRPINGAWQLSELVVVVSTAVLVGILTFALADRSTKMRVLVTPIGASVAALVMWALYNFVKPLWATWLLAGLIGAVMSCVWLGWYFAVSLVFDGHANEAGSTARTEDYKHFIRFRLTEDSLTGFVIGIDFPRAPQNDSEPDGSANKPRLIDVFTLKAHPARR
jgi:hypothetical protein